MNVNFIAFDQKQDRRETGTLSAKTMRLLWWILPSIPSDDFYKSYNSASSLYRRHDQVHLGTCACMVSLTASGFTPICCMDVPYRRRLVSMRFAHLHLRRRCLVLSLVALHTRTPVYELQPLCMMKATGCVAGHYQVEKSF